MPVAAALCLVLGHGIRNTNLQVPGAAALLQYGMRLTAFAEEARYSGCVV
jgi:hypothetical protein